MISAPKIPLKDIPLSKHYKTKTPQIQTNTALLLRQGQSPHI